MQTMPKVSLILTTYNCKENIRRTLHSIEMQNYPDIEIIIVDACSTDGTIAIIKNFVAATKYECKWVSEKDNGIYDAMNKGYFLSSGEIIAFFNDLFLSENAVFSLVSAIYKEHADGVHADLIYATDEKVKRYWKMGKGNIRNGWMPGHPTLYLKREIYEKYGVYDTSYKCSADYEFMVRILKDNNLKLAYIPQTLVRMYYGGTSTAGLDNYIVSIREAYKALINNNIRGAFWIVFMRTVRVAWQFIAALDYKVEK